MSIEFVCTQCNHTLKVSDEHAGKSARCPQCQTVMEIPQPGNAVDSEVSSAGPTSAPNNPFAVPSANPTGSDKASTNPYLSPPASSTAKQPQLSSQINPVQADFGSIFEYSWKIWQENLGILVGMTVIVLVISYGLAFIPVFAEMTIRDRDTVLLIKVLIHIVSHVVSVFLSIGLTRVCLSLARQQPTELSQLFSGTDKFLPLLGASILFGIAAVLGLVLLIIPGVIFMLLFWQYYILIADNKCSALESFSVALSIGKINKLNTFLIWIVSFGLFIAGACACCVGIIFAVPLVWMLVAVAYLQMSGQLR